MILRRTETWIFPIIGFLLVFAAANCSAETEKTLNSNTTDTRPTIIQEIKDTDRSFEILEKSFGYCEHLLKTQGKDAFNKSSCFKLFANINRDRMNSRYKKLNTQLDDLHKARERGEISEVEYSEGMVILQGIPNRLKNISEYLMSVAELHEKASK